MKIVIYAHPFDGAARNILNSLRDRYDGPGSVYLPALENVEAYLKQPSHIDNLLVLIPKDRQELDALISIGELMRDTRLILVLPEDNPGVNERSHILRPRFVTYTDCDPAQLVQVINRLKTADTNWPVKAAQ